MFYILLHTHAHTHIEPYQGTVHGPDVGLRAAPAACVELSCSAMAVSPVYHRTVTGQTPALHG